MEYLFTSGLIVFRETLEAVLVVGIILSLLSKAKQETLKKSVYLGIVIGVVVSIILAYLLQIFFGGFEGRTEELFEGSLMLVTSAFLTWMILWVHRQKDVAKRIEEKVSVHLEKGYGWGIFFLTSTSVFREGTEVVLYLKAISLKGFNTQLLGAGIGMLVALIIGFLIFKWAMRIKLKTVFNVTSIFLLFFAAGLVSHGIHEFQEAGFLPIFSFDPILNISNILSHKSMLGSILRTLFGYTSKPTLLEIVAYSFYITFIIWLERLTDRLIKTRNMG